MDKEIFVKCMKYLEAAYDDFRVTGEPVALKVWYSQLGDMPENVLMLSIQKWVATSKWKPKVADLRETAANIINPPPVPWSEAWEQVRRAIRLYGMYDEQGALESMDELTKRAVRSMGFKSLCMSETGMADRAHFQKIYERLEKEEKEARTLPAKLLDSIAQTQKELEHGRTCLPGTTE